jgi:hypothetical protein
MCFIQNYPDLACSEQEFRCNSQSILLFTVYKVTMLVIHAHLLACLRLLMSRLLGYRIDFDMDNRTCVDSATHYYLVNRIPDISNFLLFFFFFWR